MKAFFADTSYWIALTKSSRRFSSHSSGNAATQQLRLEASLVVDDVLADEMLRAIPQTTRSFLPGFALY